MLNFSKWKLSLIIIICISGILFSLPNFFDSNFSKIFSKKKINLGLDLKGGSYLLLEVEFQTYLKEQLEILKDTIRKELRSSKIGYINLKLADNNVTFTIRDTTKAKQVKTIINKAVSNLYIENIDNNFIINYSKEYLAKLHNNLIEQSIEIVRRRVDETGTREPSIQKQGNNYILLQVPGLKNPENLKNLLGKTAKLSFHLVETNFKSTNKDIFILKDDTKEISYPLYKKAILTGDLLNNAQATYNDKSQAVVSFSFNSLGAKKFADITKNNIGKPIAIVLDNKVISAPVINEPILGGSGVISGNFTIKSANDLALLLRAGALPAPLKIIEERTVGPSLGADSIAAGKFSAIVSLITIMAFMLLTYGIYGLFANIALIFNMIFIIAILTIIQATLTLPGIAGIILTMGMAVDANVLIFERIKEEAKNGLSTLATIEKGFKNAFSTILDSNLTTVIAAMLLYMFGSGTVKSFAVTLIIGILVSMFSAITLTRLMIVKWIRVEKPKKIVI